jgi:hypothetical protein
MYPLGTYVKSLKIGAEEAFQNTGANSAKLKT